MDITNVIINLIKVIVVVSVLLSCVPVMVYAERKICAFIQNRIGPNRVGPFGLLQPIADAIKLFFKEDIIPIQAERLLYIIAPIFTFCAPVVVFAVVPFGANLSIGEYFINLQIVDFNIGILFILMIAGFGAYGIIFGGWASGSKYSLLGGIRSAAQMISYELAMGLVFLTIIMSIGSLKMSQVVEQQSRWFVNGIIPAWGIFTQPLAFLIFLVTAFAETNRLPFDLPECEAELVGGYHTEYSSMKFAMFFMGEYVAMVVMSALIVTFFLGGWHFPWLTDFLNSGTIWSALCSVIIFTFKVGMVAFFYIWVRWTLPRFRYDQLMKLGWTVLVPLAFLNLLLTAIVGII